MIEVINKHKKIIKNLIEKYRWDNELIGFLIETLNNINEDGLKDRNYYLKKMR